MTAVLVVLAIGFAYSMGAHYTGACMGMPRALRAISARNALLVMAPLTLVGAALLFSVVGAGLAAGIGVHWATIGTLAVIWVIAPVVAGLLGYVLTRALGLVPAIRAQAQVTRAVLAHAISFLVSEGAGFASGHVIYVAGGPPVLRQLPNTVT